MESLFIYETKGIIHRWKLGHLNPNSHFFFIAFTDQKWGIQTLALNFLVLTYAETLFFVLNNLDYCCQVVECIIMNLILKLEGWGLSVSLFVCEYGPECYKVITTIWGWCYITDSVLHHQLFLSLFFFPRGGTM